MPDYASGPLPWVQAGRSPLPAPSTRTRAVPYAQTASRAGSPSSAMYPRRQRLDADTGRSLGEPAALLVQGPPLPLPGDGCVPVAGASVPVAGAAQLPHHVGQHAVAQCGVRVKQHQLAPRERAAQPRRALEVPAGVVVPALQPRQEPTLHEALAGGAAPAAAQRYGALQVFQGSCGTSEHRIWAQNWGPGARPFTTPLHLS